MPSSKPAAQLGANAQQWPVRVHGGPIGGAGDVVGGL